MPGCTPTQLYLQVSSEFRDFTNETNPSVVIVTDYTFVEPDNDRSTADFKTHKAISDGIAKELSKRSVSVSASIMSLSGCAFWTTDRPQPVGFHSQHYPTGITKDYLIDQHGLPDDVSTPICSYSRRIFAAKQTQQTAFELPSRVFSDSAKSKFEDSTKGHLMISSSDSSQFQTLGNYFDADYFLFVLMNGKLFSSPQQLGTAVTVGLLTTILSMGIASVVAYPVPFAVVQCALVNIRTGDILWSNRVVLRDEKFWRPEYYRNSLAPQLLKPFPMSFHSKGKTK